MTVTPCFGPSLGAARGLRGAASRSHIGRARNSATRGRSCARPGRDAGARHSERRRVVVGPARRGCRWGRTPSAKHRSEAPRSDRPRRQAPRAPARGLATPCTRRPGTAAVKARATAGEIRLEAARLAAPVPRLRAPFPCARPSRAVSPWTTIGAGTPTSTPWSPCIPATCNAAATVPPATTSCLPIDACQQVSQPLLKCEFDIGNSSSILASKSAAAPLRHGRNGRAAAPAAVVRGEAAACGVKGHQSPCRLSLPARTSMPRGLASRRSRQGVAEQPGGRAARSRGRQRGTRGGAGATRQAASGGAASRGEAAAGGKPRAARRASHRGGRRAECRPGTSGQKASPRNAGSRGTTPGPDPTIPRGPIRL